jgi:hypothetical protein
VQRTRPLPFLTGPRTLVRREEKTGEEEKVERVERRGKRRGRGREVREKREEETERRRG